jgi:hypothetical protein
MLELDFRILPLILLDFRFTGGGYEDGCLYGMMCYRIVT